MNVILVFIILLKQLIETSKSIQQVYTIKENCFYNLLTLIYFHPEI